MYELNIQKKCQCRYHEYHSKIVNNCISLYHNIDNITIHLLLFYCNINKYILRYDESCPASSHVSQESYLTLILVFDCRFAPTIDYSAANSCFRGWGEFILITDAKILIFQSIILYFYKWRGLFLNISESCSSDFSKQQQLNRRYNLWMSRFIMIAIDTK